MAYPPQGKSPRIFDDHHFPAQTALAASRHVGVLFFVMFFRCRDWRHRLDECARVLRTAATTDMGSAGMVIRAGLDSPVCDDGARGLVGLAKRAIEGRHRRNGCFHAAIDAQHALELVVFFLAFRRRRLC